MKESNIDRILKYAAKLKGWHFHMLGKSCSFNNKKGKFAMIFESDALTYLHFLMKNLLGRQKCSPT